MKLVGILTLAAAAVVVASPVMAQQDTTHKTVAVAKKAAKKENLKALTKITKDSASYHEAPRQNWRKVVGAPALFDRKGAGEIGVACVRHLERRHPHLHFFRHQLKRSQRSLPLHFRPKLSIAPHSARD